MSERPRQLTVLVTGANSFYAGAIMDKLAALNVKIHATIRNAKAAPPIEARYGSLVTVFIVPDITAPGAFSSAVHGCDTIIHVASPASYDFTDARRDMLDPAIKGAVAAVEAAASESSVRRVVLTCSVAGMIDPVHKDGFMRPGYVYSEDDWDPLGGDYERAASCTDFAQVYTASKALAERAVLDFMNRERRHFDMVSIHPAQTWGRYSQHVASAESMNASNKSLQGLMDGEFDDLPPNLMPWITGIEEVAQAHVNAVLKPEASGRYLVATAPLDWQQVVDLMRERFAGEEWVENVPKGTPGSKTPPDHFAFDNTRSRTHLGLEYQPWQQSVIGFCEQYGKDRKRFGF